MGYLKNFDDLTDGDRISVRWLMGTQPYTNRGYFRGFFKSTRGNYRILLTHQRNGNGGFFIHTKAIFSLEVESVGC